jgi:hypothetical protein
VEDGADDEVEVRRDAIGHARRFPRDSPSLQARAELS